MRDWELRVDDIADPVPGPGQVLTKVLACGICGSDLHMLKHGAELRRLSQELEAELPPDPMRPIPFEPAADTVMGHEFCCEVVELGPDVSNLTTGQVVVSMPAVFDADGIHAVGYSSRYPGGYAELLVLNELLAIPVPDGVPPSLAAMTEPLAVGVHAVNKSRITGRDAAIVLGLGPVGLACVAELKMRGIGPVIGADFSSRRRSLAEHLGCDVVVDPRDERGDRCLAARRRCPPAGDLRSRRCAGHDRASHADGAQGRPRPRRRRVHAGGSDPPDAGHRSRAQHPVRTRLRTARVRGSAPLDRRRRGRPRSRS